MAIFFGEFEQSIDAKHRMAIPAALRELIDPEEDGSNFVLMVGPDKHLWMYPDKYHRRLLRSLKRGPLPNREARKMSLFFAMARMIKPDKQGRVVLPEKSLSRAKVDSKVTLVGTDDHIEIWPTDEWERYVEESLPTYGEQLYEAADRLNAENMAE